MEEELNQRRSENKRKVSRLPATEQGLLNIQRQYEIVAKQYEFLLTKRADVGILKASNIPDTIVIDEARYYGQVPVGPNRSKNIAIGFIIGVMIPVLFVVTKSLLNNKIMSKKDIESCCSHCHLEIEITLENTLPTYSHFRSRRKRHGCGTICFKTWRARILKRIR